MEEGSVIFPLGRFVIPSHRLYGLWKLMGFIHELSLWFDYQYLFKIYSLGYFSSIPDQNFTGHSDNTKP